MGGDLPILVARLKEAQRTRQALESRLGALDEAPRRLRVDWRATERAARSRLASWRELLTRQTKDARPLLRDLLRGEPILFAPIDEPTRRGYRFEGNVAIGGLLEGRVLNQRRGEKWRPQRDSNPRSLP